MTGIFQMAEVAVPEKLFLLDAIENPSPGQGLRESAGLEFVNAVDEFDDENTGHLSHDT